MRLNEAQKRAVNHIDTPLLVLAGAGSGKTRVITSKISHLINNCGYDARNILALTFSNKAAREMKERATLELNQQQRKGLTVSTFHSLGREIIKREYKNLNLKKRFSIFIESDSRLLIENIVTDNYGYFDAKELDEIKYCIDKWKNNLITPLQAQRVDEFKAGIYQDYQRMLVTYNAVDFNDLIWLPVKLFTTNPEILHKWQHKFRYLLVDEYQDTNLSQYKLIKLLTHLQNRFTVVGDDAQSIYAWRGARPENIQQLKDDFPDLQVIMLEQNYRSTATILNCANKLISHNSGVLEKNLWSELGSGSKIKVVRLNDGHHECEYIASEILDHHLRGSIKWSDFAVLYRGKHQSKLLEKKLLQFNIPYKIYGLTGFFERAEIKDAVAYLKLIINPDDDIAYLRAVNVSRREIGPNTLEKLGKWANKRGISLFDASDEMGLSSILDDKSCVKLAKFKEFIERMRGNCFTDNPITAIRQMYDAIGLDSLIMQSTDSAEVAKKRINNVELLLESLERILIKNPDADIVDAVNKLLLIDTLERNKEQENHDEVQLMTLHAAKGLEFDHVYIMGFEEELMPHANSIEAGDNQIAEERRLAYVGLTRAKQFLTLTYASKRKKYGEYVEGEISRFSAELAENCCEYIDVANQKSAINKEQGKAYLAEIYKILGKEQTS